MAGWMKSRGVDVKRTTTAEGASAGMKDNDKLNFFVESVKIDSTDNEGVVDKHGKAGADRFVNVMLRSMGDADGKYAKLCIFHKLYLDSDDLVRAASDVQFLATYATIKDQEDEGYYADLMEAEEEPDDEILADLVGLEVGCVVGVFGKNTFVRTLGEPWDWEKIEAAAAKKGSTGRGRAGAAAKDEAPAQRGRAGGRAGSAASEPAPRGRGRAGSR